MSTQIPVVLIRIGIEENMLIEEFGDADRSYKETTSSLIPLSIEIKNSFASGLHPPLGGLTSIESLTTLYGDW